MNKRLRSVSIVIVDDHPVVLRGITMLLNEYKTFHVVGICQNGAEAIDAVRTLKPDIALLDMKMPILNGLQVLKVLVAENLPTRVIFLSASLTDEDIVAATAGGAYGIILKESAPDLLLTCLRAVAAGDKWLPAELVDGAMERTQAQRAQIAKISQLLTPREIEIMLRVADGLTNSQVGRQLNISEGTVKIHLHSIYQKVQVSNRTSLANFAATYRERLAAS
jgi:two-component system nitrate/nitrite response regulator NarL